MSVVPVCLLLFARDHPRLANMGAGVDLARRTLVRASI